MGGQEKKASRITHNINPVVPVAETSGTDNNLNSLFSGLVFSRINPTIITYIAGTRNANLNKNKNPGNRRCTMDDKQKAIDGTARINV